MLAASPFLPRYIRERSVPTVLSWCRWQRMGRTRWAAPTDRPAGLAQEMNTTQQWIFGRRSARASSLMAMHAGDISEDEYWPTFRGADGDFHSRHRPSSGPAAAPLAKTIATEFLRSSLLSEMTGDVPARKKSPGVVFWGRRAGAHRSGAWQSATTPS